MKKKFQKFLLNEKNLLKQVKFNVNFKLKKCFYFDKTHFNKKLIIKFFLNYLYKSNNLIYTKSFNNIFCFPIWQNQEIYLSFLKISNKILINSQFFKVEIIKLFILFGSRFLQLACCAYSGKPAPTQKDVKAFQTMSKGIIMLRNNTTHY